MKLEIFFDELNNKHCGTEDYAHAKLCYILDLKRKNKELESYICNSKI
uniref:Uncharacterized protein n=1 Tax=Heterorhabditis bacteriophora TaxID=37862 RepID=A0A1I7W6H6_HETBA